MFRAVLLHVQGRRPMHADALARTALRGRAAGPKLGFGGVNSARGLEGGRGRGFIWIGAGLGLRAAPQPRLGRLVWCETARVVSSSFPLCAVMGKMAPGGNTRRVAPVHNSIQWAGAAFPARAA